MYTGLPLVILSVYWSIIGHLNCHFFTGTIKSFFYLCILGNVLLFGKVFVLEHTQSLGPITMDDVAGGKEN